MTTNHSRDLVSASVERQQAVIELLPGLQGSEADSTSLGHTQCMCASCTSLI